MSCAVCRGPLSHIETEWDSSVSLSSLQGVALGEEKGEEKRERDNEGHGIARQMTGWSPQRYHSTEHPLLCSRRVRVM